VDGIELPLEYVEKGFAWLKQQASVDPARIGVIGISRGTEAALLLASMHARDFKAVVAVSPTSVVWEGYSRDPRVKGESSIKPGRSSWSLHGKPIPFLPKALTPETRARIQRNGAVDTIEFYGPAYRDKTAVKRARIPVENIEAPILLVGSEADGIWPVVAMARDIEAAMRAHDARCELLIYPDSSHVIDDACLPPAYGTHPPRSAGRWENLSFGGTAEGTVHASTESWRRIKAFFDSNLRVERTPPARAEAQTERQLMGNRLTLWR
jgi:dienelactone hydrolase